MRAFLWISALAFAAFSAMHAFITYEHWRNLSGSNESVLIPAIFSIGTALLAAWAIRQAVRGKPAA